MALRGELSQGANQGRPAPGRRPARRPASRAVAWHGRNRSRGTLGRPRPENALVWSGSCSFDCRRAQRGRLAGAPRVCDRLSRGGSSPEGSSRSSQPRAAHVVGRSGRVARAWMGLTGPTHGSDAGGSGPRGGGSSWCFAPAARRTPGAAGGAADWRSDRRLGVILAPRKERLPAARVERFARLAGGLADFGLTQRISPDIPFGMALLEFLPRLAAHGNGNRLLQRAVQC